MRASNGLAASQSAELYARASAARLQSQVLAAQFQAAKQDIAVTLQLTRNACDQTEQVHELWLMAHPNAQRTRYSAHARLQARLKSMPVIEQAKGIIMAQSGWSEDRAFDALRRASQRENVKLRDLAAKIVAKTVNSVSGTAPPGPLRAVALASEELASA
jgi:hypothetical protein